MRKPYRKWALLVVLGAGALSLARCAGDSTTNDGGADASTDLGQPDTSKSDATTDATPSDAAVDAPGDSPVDAGFAYAYVANFNNGVDGGVAVFSLPLTDASVPTMTLGSTNQLAGPESLRTDPTGKKLWVADAKGKIYGFDFPITTSSAPSVTLTTAQQPVDIAFDSAKSMWVAEFSGIVEKWTDPPTGAAAFQVHTSGGTNNFAVAFDKNDNLYVGGPGTPNLSYFSAPQLADAGAQLTNSQYASSLSGLLVVNGVLYAGSYQSGALVSYALPLTASTPATAVTGSGPYVWHLSLSPSGELVAPGLGGAQGRVEFLAPPAFTTPAIVLGGLHDPRAVAFGP